MNNRALTKKYVDFKTLETDPVNLYTIKKREYYTIQDSTGFIWGYTKDLTKAKKIQAIAKKHTDRVVGIIKGNILPLPKKYKMPLKNATISKKTTKKEGKNMATWKQVTARNLAKARRKKRQSKALSSKGLTGTLTRVKKLLFGKGRIRSTSKQVTNTRYVGRIAKGKYIYRVKKIK